MTPKQELFPRLNLARSHVEAVTFFSFLFPHSGGDVPPVDFSDLLQQDQYSRLTRYSRDKVPHLIYESIDIKEPDRNPFFYVRYATGPGLPSAFSSSNFQQAERVLQRLVDVGQKLEFSCHVDFSVMAGSEDRSVSWFPLPLPFSGPRPDLWSPISEIRGIRGVKLATNETEDPDNIDYSFILDRPRNRDVSLRVEFSVTSPLTSRLPTSILARARRVAADFDII